MRKPYWNLINDALALALFVSMISTGLIMEFILPRGEGGPRFRGGDEAQRTLIGLSRHDWGEIHAALSWALIFIILMHLALHWKWIVSMVWQRAGCSGAQSNSRDAAQSLIRRVTFIMYIAVLAAVLVLPWLLS